MQLLFSPVCDVHFKLFHLDTLRVLYLNRNFNSQSCKNLQTMFDNICPSIYS